MPKAKIHKGKAPTAPSKAYKLRVKDADGKRHSITTQPWRALTAGYALRPKSHQNKTFWHKFGLLHKWFRHAGLKNARVQPIATHFPGAPAGSAPAGNFRGKKNNPAFVCHSVAKLDVQRLPYPFSKTVSDSFLTAEEVAATVPPGAKFNRDSILRGYYPEDSRPFVARVSATLGRKFYQKLRQLK